MTKPLDIAATDPLYALSMPELRGFAPTPVPAREAAFDLEEELLREFNLYDRHKPVVVEAELQIPDHVYKWTAADLQELRFVLRKDNPEFSEEKISAEVRLTLGLNEEDMRQIESQTVVPQKRVSPKTAPLADLYRRVTEDDGISDEEMRSLFQQPADA